MFAFHEVLGPLRVAFTDRYGGVSSPPHDELSLAAAGEGTAEQVAANLDRVRQALGALDPAVVPPAHLALMRQVHGSAVAVIDDDWDPCRSDPEADALVSTRPDVALVVRVADCVPVLLADAAAGVIGAAHAGRRGLHEGVVPAAVERLRDLGARDVTAWVGPAICGACYEVPADLQREVLAVSPEARATSASGTPALDIAAGVRAQLREGGVRVVDAGRCTRESADLYSHRRDAAGAGRFGGVVWLSHD